MIHVHKLYNYSGQEGWLQKEDQLTLKLLKTVEEKSDISQRRLSSELGIALGLTNSYLNRCSRRGLIRIRGKSPRRYLYFLTPKGFAEKANLSTRYLANSLEFYKLSADEFRNLFSKYDSECCIRIILSGLSDLAEIAILIGRAANNVEIIAIYDQGKKDILFHEVPVFGNLSSLPKSDLVMVTSLDNPIEQYKHMLEVIAEDKIYLPTVLGVTL
jgi:DNA-binding MarR family transcriptional regulator